MKKFYYVYKKLIPYRKTFWYFFLLFKINRRDKSTNVSLYFNLLTGSISSDIDTLYNIIHKYGIKVLMNIVKFLNYVGIEENSKECKILPNYVVRFFTFNSEDYFEFNIEDFIDNDT